MSGHPKLKFRLEWVRDKNKDGTADFKENNDLDKPSDEQISLDNNSNKENNKPGHFSTINLFLISSV